MLVSYCNGILVNASLVIQKFLHLYLQPKALVRDKTLCEILHDLGNAEIAGESIDSASDILSHARR